MFRNEIRLLRIGSSEVCSNRFYFLFQTISLRGTTLCHHHPLVVIIGNLQTVRSTQYKNGRERAVKKPQQQEGVAILTEDSENVAIAVEAKNTTTKKLRMAGCPS
jgi:hypothetical protein